MAAVLSRGDHPGWMVSSQQPNSKRVREEDMVWGTGQGTGETEDSEVINSSLFLLKSTISSMSLISGLGLVILLLSV